MFFKSLKKTLAMQKWRLQEWSRVFHGTPCLSVQQTLTFAETEDPIVDLWSRWTFRIVAYFILLDYRIQPSREVCVI